MNRRTYGENMKINKSKLSHREQVSQRRRADLITALEAIESREKARLRVAIPCGVGGKLEQFLKEKGLFERQGIPLLIEYGLSDESEEELNKLRLEKESQMDHMYGTYCNMKFRAYEYFMENKAITIRLSFSLSKNQSLKQKLVKEGLQGYISQDEWDNWNEAKVNEFFHKYVFMYRL
jgi:predicted DNA binding CopG/RHH family protein